MSTVNTSFTMGGITASAGTAFTLLVPPSPGASRPAMMQKVVNGRPNWLQSGYTCLDQVSYLDSGTAHDLVAMRPLNWAVVSGDVAANGTVVTLLTDPGAYATTYKYSLPPEASGLVATVSNNAVAANDYVAVQLRDGTWHTSVVTSVSGLALTLTTAVPNVTGGGVEDGSTLYFFGISTDTNPATGRAHDKFKSGASSARVELLSTKTGVTYQTYSPGDPILLYSANATNAGILALVAGRYAKN